MSVDLCESHREEIAFGQPHRPPVCKTVSHKKKKPVSKQLLTFQPEGEILKPAKKVKRSVSYKRKTKASETKLKTTHYTAKSSEENLYQVNCNIYLIQLFLIWMSLYA